VVLVTVVVDGIAQAFPEVAEVNVVAVGITLSLFEAAVVSVYSANTNINAQMVICKEMATVYQYTEFDLQYIGMPISLDDKYEGYQTFPMLNRYVKSMERYGELFGSMAGDRREGDVKASTLCPARGLL
jgi:hypothetical protein